MIEELSEKRIAVLCATRSGEQWISEQVESILCQSGVTVQIFFSDDQSNDRTIEWLTTKSRLDGRLHILPPSEKFGSASMNFFRLFRDVDFNHFDYVALADQDDIWELDKLSRAVGCMRRERCEGYSSDLIAFDRESRRSWYLEKCGNEQELDYLFQGASAGCTYVLTRKAAQLVQSKFVFNEEHCHPGLSHDWLIYAICRSHGLPWFRDGNSRIFYRQHGGNAYGALPGIFGLLQRAKKVQSGWYRSHTLELRRFLSGSLVKEEPVFLAIKRFGYKDRIWLFLNAYKFRRTKKDIIFLRISIILGLF